MTPKEKSKELVDKFYDTIENNVELYKGEYLVTAKQCALVCVDEMINTGVHTDYIKVDGYLLSLFEFYAEVKEEINKL